MAMKFFLPIIFLLCISQNVLGKEIRRERSNNKDELSYQELINMNISCYPSDSCMQVRTDDSPVPAFGDKCSCHSQCWEYGTCCIDSPYRIKSPIQKCMSAGYMSYYMVYRCPDNTHPDSIWRNHCEREQTSVDDILMISPVTSLDTSRTYKNYYCFRCHETTDKYISWNLDMTSYVMSDDVPRGASVYNVTFNQTEKTWVAILDHNHISIPVGLNFVFPHNVQEEPMVCETFSVYADCPEWADKRVHAKCLAYSAVVYTKFSSYKNVHCALCNHVSLDDLTCERDASDEEVEWVGGHGGASFFRCFMDINGGGKDEKCFKKDRIDKSETCKGDYHVWNPYSGICQKTGCIVSGYVRKNDICVKP